MSNLLKAQFRFTENLTEFLKWLANQGYYVSLGEALRTQYQQDYYVHNKLSKTTHSRHQDKLAIDLNIFNNKGGLVSNAELVYFGEYWQSLHSNNKAGALWGWDMNHFETSI
jgi:hypothetical protein